MQVAIVILNWNGKHHLERSIPILLERTPHDVRIIVADGGSTDRSLEFLAERFPEVERNDLGTNLGFAGGYNAALAKMDADIFILLNSDVEVRDGWLPPLIKKLEEDAQIAAVQPKVLSHAAPTYFEHAGASGGFIDRNGYPFCRGRVFDAFEVDSGQYDAARPVMWATGTCLAIKRSAWHAAGGFDADLFAHMEEIDLCWRLYQHGYSVHVEPASVILHVGGGTLPYKHPRKTFLNFRNSLIVLSKNAPSPIIHRIFFRLCMDEIAGLKFLFDGHPAHTWAVHRSHWAFLFSLPRTLRKRMALKRKGTLRWAPGTYKGSIVWQYFVRRISKFSALDPDLFIRLHEQDGR